MTEQQVNVEVSVEGMTLQKMDEFINIIELHMKDCQINQDFRQADEIKTRLINMKAIREDTEREQIIQNYLRQRIKIEEQYLEEEAKYIVENEEKLTSFQLKKKLTIEEQLNNQKAEEKNFFKKYEQEDGESERKISNQSKSPEYLNLLRIQDHLSKQRNYKKAEMFQSFCQQIEEENKLKSQKEKQFRDKQLLEKLHKKQQYDLETIMSKLSTMEEQILFSNKKQLMDLQKKRQNQIQALDQQLSLTLTQFDRIKGSKIKREIELHMEEMEQCKFYSKKEKLTK